MDSTLARRVTDESTCPPDAGLGVGVNPRISLADLTEFEPVTNRSSPTLDVCRGLTVANPQLMQHRQFDDRKRRESGM